MLLVGLALSSYGHLKLGAGPAVHFILSVGGKVVILASLASLVVLVMARHFSEVMAQRLCDSLGFLPPHVQGKVRSIVHSFVEGMESTKDTTSVVLIVLYTLLEWGVIVACFYCMFRSVPETASYTLLQSAVFVGFVAFGSIVQLPGIGGGMQLAGIVVLTELFGLPLETAAGVALLNWISTFVIIVPFGLLLAAREGLKWGNLRHIQEVKGE